MAAVYLMLFEAERNLRRNRIFRDRNNPIDSWDDKELYQRLRFRRTDILEIVDDIQEELIVANRGRNVTPTLQVCLALRFYATGAFLNVCGDLAGVCPATAGRIIYRVTRALLDRAHRWITFPNQQEADRQKEKFLKLGGFPDVVGCIDSTHIRIQAPWKHEHEYVCRKNFHSINVQVICNADLLFIDAVAKWPGSVHDARILRQSSIFAAFETHPKPVEGVILGDSGYMSREWLMTPFLNPTTRHERRYNAAHTSTRCTVERAIGVAKRRWHCLRGLRLEPEKACHVIIVCLMLSNKARMLKLEDPEDEDDEDEDDDCMYDILQDNVPVHNLSSERMLVAAGQAARHRLVCQFF